MVIIKTNERTELLIDGDLADLVLGNEILYRIAYERNPLITLKRILLAYDPTLYVLRYWCVHRHGLEIFLDPLIFVRPV